MPPRRLRLDAELVRRGLARSREHASELVAAGRVKVAGAIATKPATGVTTDVALLVVDDPDRPDYVSRAAGTSSPERWRRSSRPGLGVTGRRCLDAGASTGGFTDVLLRAGAAEVVAVDVGYGQLAWSAAAGRAGPRARPHEHPGADARADRRSGRPRRRGPVVHLPGPGARGAARCHPRGRRPGADGEAPVRGRQGPGRQGGRGPRPRPAGRGGRRGRRGREPLAAGVPGGHDQPAARARPATWSTSCGCGTGAATIGPDEIGAEVRRTANLGSPGERVVP